jgi:hypothetical protein
MEKSLIGLLAISCGNHEVGSEVMGLTDGAFHAAIERACSAIDIQLDDVNRTWEVEGGRLRQR